MKGVSFGPRFWCFPSLSGFESQRASVTTDQAEFELSENLMDDDIDEKNGGDMRLNHGEKYINFPDPTEKLIGFYAPGWLPPSMSQRSEQVSTAREQYSPPRSKLDSKRTSNVSSYEHTLSKYRERTEDSAVRLKEKAVGRTFVNAPG